MTDKEALAAYNQRVEETLNEFRDVVLSHPTQPDNADEVHTAQRINEIKKQLGL